MSYHCSCAVCNQRLYIASFPIAISIGICQSCCSGVKSVLAGLLKFNPDSSTTEPDISDPAEALKCLKTIQEREEQLKEKEKHLEEKSNFLAGYCYAYRNQSHCDIQLKPGDDGPPIPAHKALLTTRSEIFRIMLDSDGCKASVPSETIELAEMSYSELDSVLEFLYSGDLPKEKLEKNVYALTRAAHKYKILYLQNCCEKQMSKSMNTSNVLDILEISDTCCSQNLKEAAVNFIAEHMEEIAFSDKFEAFVVKNPQLTVEIIRARVNS